MGLLANQARLLAAQAFNKRVIEEKARARQAKIDRERQEDLAKLRGVQSARAVAQRIAIEAKAKRESARVFTRVTKGARVGVLTGFEAKRDSRGRAIGISKRESQTRKNTRALLLKEIARQKLIASRESDLERFLKNERAINQGRVSSSALKRQIAERKKRGLSQTPAQKRASQFFRDSELQTALSKRSGRKGRPKLRATFGTIVSERARAKDLGSSPFLDEGFGFGGRSKREVIARGGLFGRRVGGESIETQLSFISKARSQSTSGRISFAQGLLSNINFTGSSQSSLSAIAGNKKLSQQIPATFQSRLRAGVGFFTTEAKPFTKPKLSKAGRASLVSSRKAEDFAKSQEARKEIARQARSTRQPVFDLALFGRKLDVSNLARSRKIERQNILAPPRFSGEFTLGDFGVTVQRQQAQAPRPISFLQPRDFVGLTSAQIKQRQNRNLRDQGFTPSQIRAGVQQGDQPDLLGIGGGLTPAEKKAQAQRITDENKELRLAGLEGFATPALVPATGSPSLTGTFFPPEPTPEPSGVFSVSLSEQIGISDIFSPTLTPAKKGKGKKKSSADPDNIFDLSGLLAQEAPRQRLPTTKKQPAPPRETGGILDFFSLGDSGGVFGSQSLGATFTLGEAVKESNIFDPFR